jgi:hypothetical protein
MARPFRTARRILAVVMGLTAAAAAAADGGGRAPGPAIDATGDFELRVLPTLTKIGCNSGQCHGAAGGQGGFALSLRGYDADADYDALVRERRGRRVDLDEPGNSLVLRKPSMQVPHRGGRKLPQDGAAFAEVLAWIRAGAPRSTAGIQLVGIDADPGVRLGKPGEDFALTVRGVAFSGQLLDVTDLAVLSSNDESVARVKPDGRIEIVGPGETAILVRYGNFVASADVGAPFGAPRAPKPGGGIDGLVEGKLADMGLDASPPCDDAAFVRRATLDLTGRVPSPDEVRAFLADAALDKRAKLADRLAASEAAVSRWTRFLAELCRVRQESMGVVPSRSLHAFLRGGIAARQPLDEIVRALVTSTGDFGSATGAAFNLATPGPMEQMEFVTRTFLGYRFQCAQCHQHPFDRWSRQDYFGAAAFFARARRDQGRVVLSAFGDFNDPKTGAVAAPKFPGGDLAAVPDGADRRAVFSDWLLDTKARRFDRAIVNRLWRELLGRGLVEPVDDLRDSNPPTNPALLDFLAGEFVAGKRDLRAMAASIVKTDVYARSVKPMTGAERDDRYFSHALVRPLAAPVLVDSLLAVTGADLDAPQFRDVKRASDLPDDDGGAYPLRAFGRCPRDGSIDPAAAPPATLAMALHWIHGPPATTWLAAPEGPVERIVKGNLSLDARIDEIFLVALARTPSDAERAAARAALGGGDRASVEDLLWALLATAEFSTNH